MGLMRDPNLGISFSRLNVYIYIYIYKCFFERVKIENYKNNYPFFNKKYFLI
jgi:hypothetical protein